MNSAKLRKLTLQLLILIFIVSVGYILISQKTESSINERYSQIARNMTLHLKTLIKEKEGTILQIALAMAEDQKIKNALLSKDKSKIQLQDFSLKLRENTDLKNIWFQIIDKEGKSFYRSFSDKSGDSLLEARSDVAKMVKAPQIIPSISVGKFTLSFKVMVPIYENNTFIGIFETLAQFNSIALKMDKNQERTIILVDESYKNQLVYADKERFIGNYYVANSNPDEKLLAEIKRKSPEAIINCKGEFNICPSINSIVSIYRLNNEYDKPMAHFIMAYNLDNINLDDIFQSRNNLFLIFAGVLFVSSIIFLYFQSKKRLVEELNYELEEILESKTKELTYLAHHDTLTGLANRLLFLEIVQDAIESAKRENSKFSILFLDLDRFKDVNDTHGHHAGDVLLKSVANRLKECVRTQDTVSRLAGDEFTILLRNSNEENLVSIVEKIIQAVQEPIEIAHNTFSITFSIGISCFPVDGVDADVLISNADTAMYKAKELGRNTYQFYNKTMGKYTLNRVIFEKNLKIALQEDEFEAFYQPQIDITTGRVIGAEALIRWQSPELGFVSPAEFIPIAEQSNLIIKIDLWMMKKTMHQLMVFQKEGIDIGKLSLNISAKQLEGKEMIAELKNILQETGFDASRLELEITEREMMKDPEATIVVLNKIKELGISISIDDFGTGHSSLAYIKRLPIDKLKIDKSFVDDLPHDKDDIAIVRSVISIAKHLHMDIIAEGVETPEQRDFLLHEGCSKIQGYLYSKPLPVDDYKQFLIEHN